MFSPLEGVLLLFFGLRPLAYSPHTANTAVVHLTRSMAAGMADRAHQHSFLLGIEERLLKTVFDFASGEQLALWLGLLLEITAQAGDLSLIFALQSAGAEGSTLHLAVRGSDGPHVAERIKQGDSPDSRYSKCQPLRRPMYDYYTAVIFMCT